MEVDGKLIAMIIASAASGGLSGAGVMEVRTEVKLAELQIQITNMRDVIINRIAEHKGDQETLKADFAGDIEALDERLDRHGARILDLEKRQ